jgi:hypothetical protein
VRRAPISLRPEVAEAAASAAPDPAALGQIPDAPALALAVARDAVRAHPQHGGLRFLLADRLDEAGRPAEAAEVLATLLVCGSHGRPWHRHEVAARLTKLPPGPAHARASALLERPPCEPVEPTSLARYRDGVARQLRVRPEAAR